MSRVADPVAEISAERAALPTPTRHHQVRGSYAETSRPEAIDTARNCANLANRARFEVRRRVGGISALFGAETAEALGRALEEFEEAASEGFAYYEEALDDLHGKRETDRRIAAELLRQARQDASELRVILAGAMEAEQLRHKRTPAARRKLARWFEDAVAHGHEEAPF